ncbi:unnamed protein product [Brugia timori]|uniref:Uncharacterized protein n=1 Tax=Brugia timori TaxID=42155 RepID=A0A0R3QRB1_9BILA|nr:unnamed protein product [Brugia timori]
MQYGRKEMKQFALQKHTSGGVMRFTGIKIDEICGKERTVGRRIYLYMYSQLCNEIVDHRQLQTVPLNVCIDLKQNLRISDQSVSLSRTGFTSKSEENCAMVIFVFTNYHH